jgi:hypothetical protein
MTSGSTNRPNNGYSTYATALSHVGSIRTWANDCSQLAATAPSRPTGKANAYVVFANNINETVTVMRVSKSGGIKPIGPVASGQDRMITGVQQGESFVVRDSAGDCFGKAVQIPASRNVHVSVRN